MQTSNDPQKCPTCGVTITGSHRDVIDITDPDHLCKTLRLLALPYAPPRLRRELAAVTIVDFLRARWDADQEWAERWVHPSHSTTLCGDCRLAQERVLADIAAKRRIVEEHTPLGVGYGCPVCWIGAEAGEAAPAPCLTLRLLALPYADHPDYDESWRP